MVEGIPIYINLLFGLTVLVTIGWAYRATKSRKFLILVVGWAALQSIIGLSGVYQNAGAIPPRMVLFGIFPTLVLITVTFLTRKGRMFIDSINLKTLTYFHTIRVPVEIVLTLLYYQGLVSVYMTFEGTNFDLFSGLTAAPVAYIAFQAGVTKKQLLKWWNVLCLLLLLNVVITAIFALPSPFQKLSLGQPNIAVLMFPFNLLPTVIAPIVFFGHLVAIRQLYRSNSNTN